MGTRTGTTRKDRAERIRGSHLAAWRLGKRLIALRQATQLTRERAAVLVGLSQTTLERTEHGQREVDPGEVWKIQRTYGFSTEILEELVTLAEATSADAAWFDRRDDLPEGFSLYGELEASAAQISAYEPRVVFGLLQAPDYARAVIEKAGTLTAQEVEKRLAFRMARQEVVLRHPAPRVIVVLASSALEVVVGPPVVMDRQLEHLRTLSKEAPHIDIRIRPGTANHLPQLGGPFIHLRFPDDNGAQMPEMVYAETYLGAKYIETSETVSQLSALFDALISESIPIEEYL